LFFDSVTDMHSLFSTVFAATAATIVSGTIAERTKFSTYLIFSLMMTFIYPISGHWVWQGEGWLT
jgi:Amt family ammonium transporter